MERGGKGMWREGEQDRQRDGESREVEAGHGHVKRGGREFRERGSKGQEREARVREGGGGKQPLL